MRPLREDHPDKDWLITNRGLAKRAVFETRQDVERFCEALGRAVALGLIEVHAFVFMTTDFPLRLISVSGAACRAWLSSAVSAPHSVSGCAVAGWPGGRARSLSLTT